MIFDKPLLKSKQLTVQGKAFTLYELTAESYVENILTEAYFAEVEKRKEAEPAESVTPTPDKMAALQRMAVAEKRRFLAASLWPGYPDLTVDSIEAELKQNVSLTTLNELHKEAWDLQFSPSETEGPKPSAPVST